METQSCQREEKKKTEKGREKSKGRLHIERSCSWQSTETATGKENYQ